MDTYKEQFQKLQEYAFNVLREYPLDKTAVNVLSDSLTQKRKIASSFLN